MTTATATPTINARADRRFIRAHDRSRRFVLVDVVAPPAVGVHERPPVNLAFVIDRSGSMSGEKLELAKQAVDEAIARLEPRDRFSVVAYDDTVQVVAESSLAFTAAKRSAVARLRELGPGGSTNLSGGWFTGCEQVARFLETEAVNRTLLLTDGLANVGLIDRDALAGHAAELRTRGVSTTTFGVGNDFDEALLQAMSDAGGGHFYYIANPAQIRDHIASEVGETLEVVARDVELELVAGDGIAIETISPQTLVSRGSRSIVTLGDLVADQAVEVVLRVTFPYGERGRETGLIVGDGRGGDVRLAWTYADDRTNDDQPRDAEVDRAVGRQFAARARQEAVRLNRDGDFEHARRRLAATARRIAGYASRDAELLRLVRELEAEGVTFAAPMPAAQLKEAHFVSANVARSRDPLGRSVRRT